ncbi:MAG: alpha/beta hydrolase-fold protein [Gemmataceae bacterium]
MHWQAHDGPGLAWLERGPDDPTVPLIIWWHGFGANAADLVAWCGPADRRRRHVLPEGPLSDASQPNLRAWYERGGNEHPATVAATLARVQTWLEHLFTRYQPRVTAMVGFSQGGAMVLRVGLPHPERFAGLAVLSGSLRRVDDLTPTLPPLRTQRLFIGHGRNDEIVPCEVAQRLVSYLRQQGYTPHFQTYAIGHSISPRESHDLECWLAAVLGLHSTASPV